MSFATPKVTRLLCRPIFVYVPYLGFFPSFDRTAELAIVRDLL
jgi:hypothetical protein